MRMETRNEHEESFIQAFVLRKGKTTHMCLFELQGSKRFPLPELQCRINLNMLQEQCLS